MSRRASRASSRRSARSTSSATAPSAPSQGDSLGDEDDLLLAANSGLLVNRREQAPPLEEQDLAYMEDPPPPDPDLEDLLRMHFEHARQLLEGKQISPERRTASTLRHTLQALAVLRGDVERHLPEQLGTLDDLVKQLLTLAVAAFRDAGATTEELSELVAQHDASRFAEVWGRWERLVDTHAIIRQLPAASDRAVSLTEAAKETKFSKSTISKWCDEDGGHRLIVDRKGGRVTKVWLDRVRQYAETHGKRRRSRKRSAGNPTQAASDPTPEEIDALKTAIRQQRPNGQQPPTR